MNSNETEASKTYSASYTSPVGTIEIIGTQEAILSIDYVETEAPTPLIREGIPQVVKDCWRELDEYFNGTRVEFTVRYVNKGTDFQLGVWQALTAIPYGETASYQAIARAIDNEKAVRAVGTANGKNKLSIIVPCHRIIGANGTLTGYAGGLWRKEWLLAHEQKNKQKEEKEPLYFSV